VSSGIDEKVEYDMDAIRKQMEAAMPESMDFDDPFMDAPAAGADAEEDPFKAMETMESEAASTPAAPAQ
jgi:hypothetical protein